MVVVAFGGQPRHRRAAVPPVGMPQEKTLQSIAKLVAQLVCVLAAIILVCWLILFFSPNPEPSAAVQGPVSPRRFFVGSFLLLLGSSLWLQHAGERVKAAKAAALGALAIASYDFIHYLSHWL